MSTRSYIGVKEGTKITFIYCHFDGSLDRNGVLLNMFYKDPQKVRDLINLGHVSSIGYNIESPEGFNQYDDYTRNQVNVIMDNHVKTSFVYAYCRDRGEKDMRKPSKSNLKNFLLHGEEYNYLYDIEAKKWYLVYMREGKKLIYDLNKVLTDKSYFNKCVSEVGIYDDFKRIQYNMELYKTDLSLNIIEKYNMFLKKNGITDVEFDYVKGQTGERIFGVLKKEDGKQRRKVIARDNCLGLLCYNTLCHYKGQFPHEEKLTLSDIAQFKGDAPLF